MFRGEPMIDKPTKTIGSELYTARIQNMATAQYFGLVKEYSEILNQTPIWEEIELHKEKPTELQKAQLIRIYKVRKELNKLIQEKLNKEKILKFGGNKK
tara:strand:+ start:697 stop:993 length:297 start_codon:yes stop_codon:yes gene_type:complete